MSGGLVSKERRKTAQKAIIMINLEGLDPADQITALSNQLARVHQDLDRLRDHEQVQVNRIGNLEAYIRDNLQDRNQRPKITLPTVRFTKENEDWIIFRRIFLLQAELYNYDNITACRALAACMRKDAARIVQDIPIVAAPGTQTYY